MASQLLKAAPFTLAEASAALARAKKSQNGNNVSVAKTFYYETYRRLLAKPEFVGVVQNNNLTAAEFKTFKQRLAEKGFVATQVRNALFVAAARDAGLPREVSRLFVGPSIVFFAPTPLTGDASTSNPAAAAVAVVSSAALGPILTKKVLIAGAIFESKHVLSKDQLERVAELPSKQRLHEQLVGLLSAPASRLVGVLSSQPSSLLRTLQGRV
ncbi:UNVERIFIED_CONTAM: hypothetical protein HDU68_005593 [Siphonaria sp. JEL0065]|nr:hypothetical protein HDU68_005593 [Siphonaria sp. JEL0065]